ncbi:unnamed protein product [Lepeophtheirus salmonis]|uniref:(salmon louse) hypothetical protein n=1 Tax=Lepeophtheirus salmonis TaxID=72036 RepID=A0A7R8D504_LEPSM|nr:unnamed protein product [Lepeophtheirus salmonis]CAF3000123.1 unnamed protein product [Lepeophtheirus salmonis]
MAVMLSAAACSVHSKSGEPVRTLGSISLTNIPKAAFWSKDFLKPCSIFGTLCLVLLPPFQKSDCIVNCSVPRRLSNNICNAYENGLLFFGNPSGRVPSSLRKRILKNFTYLIVEPWIALCYAGWPNMDNYITNLVNACNICHANAQSPLAKYVSLSPVCSWERVHADFLQFKGQDILILVDGGSEAAAMSNNFTFHTLQQLLYSRKVCRDIEGHDGEESWNDLLFTYRSTLLSYEKSPAKTPFGS